MIWVKHETYDITKIIIFGAMTAIILLGGLLGPRTVRVSGTAETG